MPLMIAPKALRLVAAPHIKPCPASGRSYAGAGGGLIELQASVTLPISSSVGSLMALGCPARKLSRSSSSAMRFGAWTCHASISASSVVCLVACSICCHFGLPLAIALIGSYLRKPLPPNCLHLGELDLYHRVRDLPLDLLQGLCAALDAGEIATPVTLYVPPSAAARLPHSNGRVRVEPCPTLEVAIQKTWPDFPVN